MRTVQIHGGFSRIVAVTRWNRSSRLAASTVLLAPRIRSSHSGCRWYLPMVLADVNHTRFWLASPNEAQVDVNAGPSLVSCLALAYTPASMTVTLLFTPTFAN